MIKKYYSVAVVLAAYNGEKYIDEQIRSILPQLGKDDALFIADDCSRDSTCKILENYADERIHIIKNELNIGYVANFDRLINEVDADYLFFSDQDDVWVEGRVASMIGVAIESKKNIVFGRFIEIGGAGSECGIKREIDYNKNPIINIIRLLFGCREFSYFGSTLMITRSAKNYLFPLITHNISHDIWIALLGNIKSDIFHFNQIVTMRRIHDSNVTKSNRKFYLKISTRLIWLKFLFLYAIG